MTKSRSEPPKEPKMPGIIDEPGMADRFQRTLRNLLNTPPKPREKAGAMRKDRTGPAKRNRGKVTPNE